MVDGGLWRVNGWWDLKCELVSGDVGVNVFCVVVLWRWKDMVKLIGVMGHAAYV